MITLQSFTFPETSICTEQALYYRAQGDFGYSYGSRSFLLQRGATLSFDTYFNLFNIAKWQAACDLDGLFAEVTGSGLAEIRVYHAIPEKSWELLSCEIVTLTKDQPYQARLDHYAEHSTRGIFYIEVKALEDAVTVTGGRFASHGQPPALPRLAVSITTFKREEHVRKTVQRLEAFLETFPFGDRIHVQVVDNGNSAEIAASDRVTPITNANYGGAGGFARGLMEAEQNGFTHCLFMDDDASFHMENIARAYTFLAMAREPNTAIAGAMINNTHKWAIWENGAVFNGSCHPLYCGLDLRDPEAVREMEFDSALPRPSTFYGGWWFFAFAVDAVRHYPFPFFVRGDDISFSLMNDFEIHTLNGVVSFQDDFSEKESPQTLYLDLRNHLIHHLVKDDLDRSALGTAKIAIRFIMRSLLRFHYETAQAQLLAWQDVMQGPDFFDENIDMSNRRATIKALTRTEAWHLMDPKAQTERRRLTTWSVKARHRLGVWLLNGHVMPFSRWTWDRVVLNIGDRGLMPPAFGATRLTYVNTARDKGYTVTQSKRKFYGLAWQMTRTLIRFLRDYDQIKAAYRRGYDHLATRAYWEQKLRD